MGLDSPLRMASTPATKVVASAPIPGRRTPSRPSAGAIVLPFPVAIARPPDALFSVRAKCGSYHTRVADAAAPDLGRRGGDAPGAREEGERGRRQLDVVARTDEAAFNQVVVQ